MTKAKHHPGNGGQFIEVDIRENGSDHRVPIEPRMISQEEAKNLSTAAPLMPRETVQQRVTRNLIYDLAHTVNVLGSQAEARREALERLVDDLRRRAADAPTAATQELLLVIAEEVEAAGLDKAW